MTLGEIDLKFRLLENFSVNLKKIKYDKETSDQLMKQARRVLAEVDEMIKINKEYVKHANDTVKELKLQSFIKSVRVSNESK